MEVGKKVGLVYGEEWLRQCDRLPKVSKRTSKVLSLIKSYGLTQKLTQIKPRQSTFEELNTFHSAEYLEHCKKATLSSDLEKLANDQQYFGLDYDCPLVPDTYGLVSWIAGGTLSAAESLTKGDCFRSINWGGGWHHAQRDEASGFCYVNDIVLGIHHLKSKFDKILYIDLDVHHGDGVENAFAFTQKVFTFSIHKFEKGFFPGTGSIDTNGFGKGKFYNLNVPLKDGTNDEQFFHIFDSIYPKILQSYRPDCLVVQCGADCLSQDPLGGFNLTLKGLGKCISKILESDLPILFLGGGGYYHPNVARCWTFLTWLILSSCHTGLDPLDDDIPDEDPFFPIYGPSFELQISPGLRQSLNSSEEIQKIIKQSLEYLEEVR